MNRKHIGIILLVLAAASGVINYFHMQDKLTLNSILHASCNLPDGVCPFTNPLPEPYLAGFVVAIFIAVIGIYEIVSDKSSRLQQTKKKENTKSIVKTLNDDEKKIYSMVEESGAIFQSDLVEKSGTPKVRMTRILDKLESKGLVERRRRGMTNMVMIKNGNNATQ